MVSYQIIVAVAVLGSVLAVPPLAPYSPGKPAPSVYRYRWSVNGPRDAYFDLTEDEKEEICKECKPLGSGLGGFFAIEGDPVHYIRCVPQGDSWQVIVLHCCNNTNQGGGSTKWDQKVLTCAHDPDDWFNPYPCDSLVDTDPGVPPTHNQFWPLVWTPHLDTLEEDRDFPFPVARVFTGVYTFAGGHVQRGFRMTDVPQTIPTIEFDGQQVLYFHNTAQYSYSHMEVPYFQIADWSTYLPGFTFTLGFCVDPGSPPHAALITNADCSIIASVELTLRVGYMLEAMIRTDGGLRHIVSLPLPAPRPSGCYFAGFSYTRATNQMLLWLDDGTSVTGTASGPPKLINNPLFFGYSCYGYPDTSPPRALDGALAAIHIWGDRALNTAEMNIECLFAGFCPV